MVAPRVFPRTVELSPLGALVATLLGNALAGVHGAMLALPVAAALKVLYQRAKVELGDRTR